MAAKNLQCRECQATYPLDARYVCERCFGPLEVAYDHGRAGRGRAAACGAASRAGPQNIWRYADFLPLERPASRATARPACPPAARR